MWIPTDYAAEVKADGDLFKMIAEIANREKDFDKYMYIFGNMYEASIRRKNVAKMPVDLKYLEWLYGELRKDLEESS